MLQVLATPFLHPLALFFKQLAKEAGLNSTYNGGISRFALWLLALAFLIKFCNAKLVPIRSITDLRAEGLSFERVRETLDQIANVFKAPGALVGFMEVLAPALDYFADFDCSKEYINLREGGIAPIAGRWGEGTGTAVIHIMDPIVPDLDHGGSVLCVPLLLATFRKAELGLQGPRLADPRSSTHAKDGQHGHHVEEEEEEEELRQAS